VNRRLRGAQVPLRATIRHANMTLEKYSLGIGDRFGLQGVPQLRALAMASGRGVRVSPVWNKSNREHAIIGTHPRDTRKEADDAVRALEWRGGYFVDADHIGAPTVERFMDTCDFFTIDVADFIGTPASPDDVTQFLRSMGPYTGTLRIPGLEEPMTVDGALLRAVADRYLNAVKEAGRVYRTILSGKSGNGFIPEVSLDESESPQSPAELFLILGAIAAEGIPLETIAPKFTGSFLKGVDYVGDPGNFTREFERDIAVIAFAAQTFDLPGSLKLSVHTGSDKFSLYPSMHRAIRKFDAGLHLKTAGTTWVEEVIGLAETGGEGLRTAKEIYALSYGRFEELCAPYLQVISIDFAKLPLPSVVASWQEEDYAGALRHDPRQAGFNPDFRQLIHVGYKVAAEMGPHFTGLLRRYADHVGRNVTENLYSRHIVPLFLGAEKPD
jgi:tagaturonate epimerase